MEPRTNEQPILVCVGMYFKQHMATCGSSSNLIVVRDMQRHPATCMAHFLKSVEPTVNLDKFCDDSWNNSDIMCKEFLYQNGLPLKNNCVLPKWKQVVPKLVYYVIFSPKPGRPPKFRFMHYLSVVSAKRFITPWAIYVIGDVPPTGYWWTRVLSDVTGVRYVYRKHPHLTSGTFVFMQHASDVVRLQTLIANGGIYLDTDMLILKPIDTLLNKSLSLGLLDNATGMGNAFITVERGNPLLMEWYKGYTHFNKSNLFQNSLLAAKALWLKNPSAVNEISLQVYRPNWYESEKLFLQTGGLNWTSQVAIHIWHRHGHVPRHPQEMYSLNTTLGEIFRFLYFERFNLFSTQIVSSNLTY